jgi:hypothetical protein
MSDVLSAIGSTPLVRLRAPAPENGAELCVKLENLNPTGSMKDRIALATIEGAERDGLIEPGAAELAREPGTYATCQFNNPYVVPGHREMLGRVPALAVSDSALLGATACGRIRGEAEGGSRIGVVS